MLHSYFSSCSGISASMPWRRGQKQESAIQSDKIADSPEIAKTGKPAIVTARKMQDQEINFKRRPVGSCPISEVGIRDELVKTTERRGYRLSRHSYIHYIFEHLAQVASRHSHSPNFKGATPRTSTLPNYGPSITFRYPLPNHRKLCTRSSYRDHYGKRPSYTLIAGLKT